VIADCCIAFGATVVTAGLRFPFRCRYAFCRFVGYCYGTRYHVVLFCSGYFGATRSLICGYVTVDSLFTHHHACRVDFTLFDLRLFPLVVALPLRYVTVVAVVVY
jgi:hypothetical protein